MVYSRGSADDFTRYADLTGEPGWSWDQILPYFFKVGFCFDLVLIK
jgi:choline dehydrogenase